MTTHNVFLAADYKGSFDRIFEEHALPDEPSFYVNVPSRADPSAAPEGRDTMVVLVPVGHLLDDASDTIRLETPDGKARKPTQDWPTVIARARAHVVELLTREYGAELGVKSFEEVILSERTNTPLTWRDDYNLHKGAILGLSHSVRVPA